MKAVRLQYGWLVRLDPGEEFVASIVEFARVCHIKFAAIVSGVGMVERARLGFFRVAADDYEPFDLGEGPYDLSSVSGNVTVMDGKPWPHVHIVVNDPRGRTLSGHVLNAYCHITAELVLVEDPDSAVLRKRISGIPASRLDDE